MTHDVQLIQRYNNSGTVYLYIWYVMIIKSGIIYDHGEESALSLSLTTVHTKADLTPMYVV